GRFDQPRLAYRDVAGPTNRLTLIAAILPRGCVSTHTVFCLRTPLALADQQLLCGLFNSLVVNYFVRLRVTTHVTTAIVEALRVPRAETAPATCHDIVTLTRRLQQHDDREALATLNAHVARLYQLTRAEFEHVAGTFPLVKAEDRHRALSLF